MKKCWKCAEEIQDEAIACRFCNTNQASLDRARFNLPPPISAKVEKERRPLGCFGGGAAIIIAVFIAMKLNPTGSDPQAMSDSNIMWQNDLPETPIEQLLLAFATNEVRGEEEYGNRRIRISGVLRSVDAGFGESANVTIAASQKGQEAMNAALIDGQRATVATIDPGQAVVVQCETVTEILGDPYGSKCLIAKP